MEVFGKATINPAIFYSGKVMGYFTWIGLILAILHIEILSKRSFTFSNYISYGLLISGLLLALTSLIQLGRSTRFGLPTRKTMFRTSGIYRFSRNPMYLGFNFITIASMIYFLTPLIIIPGIYSITVYHFIILGEEKYLETAFGEDYREYKSKVRRYI